MDLNSMLTDAQRAGADQKSEHPPSAMQQAIYDAIRDTSHNLSIEAVAGSGKTTTLIKAMSFIKGDQLFLAFNKSIADELRDRTPMGVDCKTFNALGHAMLKRKTGGRLDKYKFHNRLQEVMSRDEYRQFGFEIVRVLSRMRSGGWLTPPSYYDFQHEIEHSNVPMTRINYAAQRLSELWELALDVSDSFVFDDQLYMPVYWNMKFPQYDVVFVDEAQDLNAIQHMMLAKLAERGARVIAVGDSRQAIYGFRGALTDSMRQLRSKFDTVELPLDICYRCSEAIVRHAQDYVPQIQWRADAPKGEIIHKDYLEPSEYETNAMIMCRTNAPLFQLALKFLRKRVPCHLSSNFGPGLIAWVKGFKSVDTASLATEIKEWRYNEVKQAEELELYHKIPVINDKARCILPFCEEYKLRNQIVGQLQILINSDAGPALCTVHKAKGLEADHAYILRPDLMPAPWVDEGTEEKIQEENLHYVAITRAKNVLVYVQDVERRETEE